MILITGATGLVGAHLTKQLATTGTTIKAVYRNENKIPSNLKEYNNIQWLCGDILDIPFLETAMQGAETVFHCAALVSFIKKDADNLYNINEKGTANVVNTALAQQVKRLIHVSSVAALGRLRAQEPVTESMQWTPDTSNSVYGHSKYLGELQVWRGMEEGLRVAVVNPVVILGCTNWDEGSSAIFKNVYQQFPWYATGITGWVDVDDVVKALLLLYNNNINGERYIISAENQSYEHIFNLIAKYFNKKPPHKQVKAWQASIVWRLEAVKYFFTGKKPLVTKETAQTALSKTNFNNSKLLKAFPEFSYQPLEKSIERICGEYKAKYNLL
jgi:dihydroflavonol-4-reductase